MKIWWLLSAKKTERIVFFPLALSVREGYEGHMVSSFSGWTSYFSKLSPTCNMLTFQEGLPKKGQYWIKCWIRKRGQDLKMVNQMIPWTVLTPKNFSDQVCQFVYEIPAFWVDHFHWISDQRGAQRTGFGHKFSSKSLYWMLQNWRIGQENRECNSWLAWHLCI